VCCSVANSRARPRVCPGVAEFGSVLQCGESSCSAACLSWCCSVLQSLAVCCSVVNSLARPRVCPGVAVCCRSVAVCCSAANNRPRPRVYLGSHSQEVSLLLNLPYKIVTRVNCEK